LRVGNNSLELPGGEFVQRGGDARMAQKTFGRHHNQRFAPSADDLPAQHMKILRGRRRVHNLDIVFGRQREKTFEARARMLRPAAFKPVRQQQHQPGQPPPFVFSTGDELVNDDLGGVDEISKLRLP